MSESPSTSPRQLPSKDRIVRIGNRTGFAVCALLFVPWPAPWLATVAVVLALTLLPAAVALNAWAYANGVFGPETTDRPPLIWMYWAPAIGLALRSYIDLKFLDEGTLFLYCAAAAAVLAVLLMLVDRRTVRFALIVTALAYAYGATAQFDTLGDTAKPKTYHTLVADKQTSSRRGGSSSYVLSLTDWQPYAAPRDVDVSGSFYDQVHVGNRVCVFAHPGNFAIRWYDVDFC